MMLLIHIVKKQSGPPQGDGPTKSMKMIRREPSLKGAHEAIVERSEFFPIVPRGGGSCSGCLSGEGLGNGAAQSPSR